MSHKIIRLATKGSRDLESVLEQALEQVRYGEVVCGVALIVTKDADGKKDAQFYSAGELTQVESVGWVAVMGYALQTCEFEDVD